LKNLSILLLFLLSLFSFGEVRQIGIPEERLKLSQCELAENDYYDDVYVVIRKSRDSIKADYRDYKLDENLKGITLEQNSSGYVSVLRDGQTILRGCRIANPGKVELPVIDIFN